eukprot:3750474-Rhodomonas_salina.1
MLDDLVAITDDLRTRQPDNAHRCGDQEHGNFAKRDVVIELGDWSLRSDMRVESWRDVPDAWKPGQLGVHAADGRRWFRGDQWVASLRVVPAVARADCLR